MTIEEKAKAYDEALARANGMIKAMITIGGVAKVDDIQHIFPELKESEDERIRKGIITYLEQSQFGEQPYSIDDDIVRDYIAWLEKRDEQKPAEYTLEQAAGIFLDALSNTPYNNKPITDAQVITKELLKFLADTSSYNPNAINEQKSAWSEEDEYCHNIVLYALNNECVGKTDKENAIDWLNFLKGRVQSQYKPTGAQLASLEIACDRNDRIGFDLTQLLKDLKKL